jgi:hypothetical protein
LTLFLFNRGPRIFWAECTLLLNEKKLSKFKFNRNQDCLGRQNVNNNFIIFDLIKCAYPWLIWFEIFCDYFWYFSLFENVPFEPIIYPLL